MGQKKRNIDDYKLIIKCETTMAQKDIDYEFCSLIELFNEIIIVASMDPNAKDIFSYYDISLLYTNLK